MFLSILLTLGFNIVQMYQYNITTMYIYNSTVFFVNNFLKAKRNYPDCDIDKFIKKIYFNSFQMTNYLGDYYKCSSYKMNFYYFLLYKSEITPQLKDKQLCDIYPLLLYEDFYGFAMCLPWCFQLDNYVETIPNFNDRNLSLIYFNITNKTDILYQEMNYTGICIILSIVLFLFMLSIFFAMFPNYSKLKNFFRYFKYSICCIKERRYSEDNIFIVKEENRSRIRISKLNNTLRSIHDKLESEKEELITNKKEKLFIQEEERNNTLNKMRNDSLIFEQSESSRLSLYDKISYIFNIKKSIKRLSEDNQFINKINSKYRNDNSLGFINGMKSLNMLVMILNSLCWQLLLVPTTKTTLNHHYIESVGLIMYQIVVLYYMYFSFSIYWCLHGFLLGYKFLFHMKTRKIGESLIRNKEISKEIIEKREVLIKLLTFIFQQCYLYFLYIFMIFLTVNMDKFVYIYFPKNEAGTLFFLFTELGEKMKNQSLFFIFPIINFLMGNLVESKDGSVYYFFYFFANEIQFFIISIILLFIYSKKGNNFLSIIFLIYFISLFVKALTYSIEERNYKTLLGIDVFFLRLHSGFSLYYIGVVMGLLYFEYNTKGITYSRIHSFSSKESLDESEGLIKQNNIRDKINYIFSKHSLVYIFVFISLLSIIFLIDYFSVFQVLKTGKLNEKIPLIFKIILPIETDIFLFALFIIVFRFFIVNKSSLKGFFERRFWIIVSRSFYVIMFLAMPICLMIVLNSTVTIKVTFFKIVLIYIGLCFILICVSSVLMVVIEVPLKVAFKKVLKKIIDKLYKY